MPNLSEFLPLIALFVILTVVKLALVNKVNSRGTEKLKDRIAMDEGMSPCVKKTILNGTERKLLGVLDRYISRHDNTLRVSLEVSYGAFIQSESPSVQRSLINRRADFVLWTNSGDVRCVVEMDGSGHWGETSGSAKTAHNSDAIKNAACAAAGITIIRVQEVYTAEDVFAALNDALQTTPS